MNKYENLIGAMIVHFVNECLRGDKDSLEELNDDIRLGSLLQSIGHQMSCREFRKAVTKLKEEGRRLTVKSILGLDNPMDEEFEGLKGVISNYFE